MGNNKKRYLKGKKVATLIAGGFDASTLNIVKQALAGKGVQMKIVAMTIGNVKVSDGSTVKIDISHISTGSIMFDAILSPEEMML